MVGMQWWILAVAAAAKAAVGEALEVLQVERVGGTPLELVVAGASFGGSLPRPTADQRFVDLVTAEISSDCSHAVAVGAVPVGAASAMLLDRGGSCSFVEKAVTAQNAGASLLVVGDTIQGAYQAGKQAGQPIFDCTLGQATVAQNVSDSSRFPSVEGHAEKLGACWASGDCKSATCVYTGAPGAGLEGFEVCCFVNSFVIMRSDPQNLELATGITIPAVFASYKDAQVLRSLVADSASMQVRVFSVEESPWNISMLLSWLLGVLAVIGGAYCSATDERKFSYERVALGNFGLDMLETQYASIGDNEHSAHCLTTSSPVDDEEDGERIKLSSIHALYFVIGSSSVLVLLYYGHLAMLMNITFMVGTTASMAQIVILPVLRYVVSHQPCLACKQERLLPIVGLALAASISVYWFVHRLNGSIWPLQDVLCITLCFVVIDSIQLPSLKVATVLLSVAFAYDVFFVYISPLIFGSSVMVEVASGRDSIHTEEDMTPAMHERLPMILSVPLLFSYYGGNALLGLGDLILPGLLVSLCIRYDYCMAYPLSRSYFLVSSLSYAVGLLVANFMAIALREIVEGQPALMYIVPIMLSSVVMLASHKQELHELWRGPQRLRMELALAISLNERTTPKRDEVEPFLKRRR